MRQTFNDIGPGLGSFVVIFVLATALILLVRSLVKHLRKVRVDAEVAAAEVAERNRAAEGTAS